MHLPRIVESNLTIEPASGVEWAVVGENFHYLLNVLRLRVRDRVEVFDSTSNRSFFSEISDITKSQITLRFLGLTAEKSIAKLNLILGTPKPTICDTVVEKAVELGVNSISFFQASRSQGSFDIKKRQERLQKIAQSSLKQSGCGILPEISFHEDISSVIKATYKPIFFNGDTFLPDLKLVCLAPNYDVSAQTHKQLPKITHFIDNFKADNDTKKLFEKDPKDVDLYVMVGPEGGLTEREIENAFKQGFNAVSLGESTLRVEIAVVVACGLTRLYF